MVILLPLPVDSMEEISILFRAGKYTEVLKRIDSIKFDGGNHIFYCLKNLPFLLP